MAEPSHHVLDVLGSQGDMRRERPMEYRWAVGEGQRGILSRGMGWGCIDKPPLKPGVRRGSQTWGIGR